MSEPTRRRIDWPSTLVEVALILFGLLLAFGADRLWEGRQEEARQAQYVARLHAEFQATGLKLDTAIQHQTEILAAGGRILAALAAADTSDPLSTLANAIPVALDFLPVVFVTAAYDEMKSSGSIAILRDPDLRIALAELDALRTNEIARAEESVWDEWIHRVQPFLAPNVASDIYVRPPMRRALAIPPYPGGAVLSDAVRGPEFWSLITHRLIIEDYRKGLFERARQVVSRIIQLTSTAGSA